MMNSKLIEYYRKAYAATGMIGWLSKGILLIGLMAAGGTWRFLTDFSRLTNKEPTPIFYGCMAVLCFVMFYVLHVVIAAIGQILKATLDTAVNTSPMLKEEERVQILSVPPN